MEVYCKLVIKIIFKMNLRMKSLPKFIDFIHKNIVPLINLKLDNEYLYNFDGSKRPISVTIKSFAAGFR